MDESRFPLRVVVRRTGLSPQIIRAWESRYAAVVPARTESRRRLYTGEDIARLSLLRELTHLGHTISQVARLSFHELQRRLQEEKDNGQEAPPVSKPRAAKVGDPEELIEQALAATALFDAEELQRVVESGSLALGRAALLRNVIAPLAERIGVAWREGRLKIAHEHFITAQLRILLGPFDRVLRSSRRAPCLLVTTPTDQWHELGALLVAAAAHSHGWRVVYLGPSLPAEEIAAAAQTRDSEAIALSLVYPENDPEIPSQLTQLRRFLPEPFPIIIGGRASESYSESISEIAGIHVLDLQDLYATLDRVPARAHPNEKLAAIT